MDALPNLITRRHHDAAGQMTLAVYSPCERYRYRWLRSWAEQRPRLTFVMLNPSTATELATDPTVEGCFRRAMAWGFGSLQVLNLFAYRATEPEDMKAAADPVGPENDATLLRYTQQRGRADVVIAGWGVHGEHLARAAAVRALLGGVPLHVLRLTKGGQPGHPLYIPRATKPRLWEVS